MGRSIYTRGKRLMQQGAMLRFEMIKHRNYILHTAFVAGCGGIKVHGNKP